MADPRWWRQAVVYEVYVRSFADSDGDGIGDLPGITARLPYLAELGVDAVWLTPFYPSPMADGGYDVADPLGVDPLFGTLADLDRLVEVAHGLGLRVVVDVVPNHVSSAHPWFREAVQDPASPLRDRFFFREPKPDGPPNNWPSQFRGSAWTAEPGPGGQSYLHLFTPDQPDLNWDHPAVVALFDEVLDTWSARGVDGFRIDVAHGLVKAEGLPDLPEPVPADLTGAVDVPFANQPAVHDVYRRWRDRLPQDRLLVGEVYLYDQEQVASYVGPDELGQAFDFTLSLASFTADSLAGTLLAALEVFGARGVLPTYVLSNHDIVRAATRWGGGQAGRERAIAGLALVLGLPGSTYLYQGDELALEQVDVEPELRQDPIWTRSGHTEAGRDGARTPMPWTAVGPGHGFTTGAAWLPFGPDAITTNVASQQADPESAWSTVARLLALRRRLLPSWGDAVRRIEAPPGVLALQRDGGLTIVTNTLDTAVSWPSSWRNGARVLAATRGAGVGQDIAARSTTWLAG